MWLVNSGTSYLSKFARRPILKTLNKISWRLNYNILVIFMNFNNSAGFLYNKLFIHNAYTIFGLTIITNIFYIVYVSWYILPCNIL